MDNTLAFIKNVMSGAIIDPDRLVIGTEEGLFCLDLDRSGKLSYRNNSDRNINKILINVYTRLSFLKKNHNFSDLFSSDILLNKSLKILKSYSFT